jgi:hypothetical protein
VATDFYKELFGPSSVSSINMSNFHMNSLSEDDRTLLTAPFSSEEIKLVVFSLKHNSAPGPDGIPAEFFKIFGISSTLICGIYSKTFMMGCLTLKDLTSVL